MKVTSDKRYLHYTIYKDGKKYRTKGLTQEEFDVALSNTDKDWRVFLKKSKSYYKVK
jgi:hypothetical protein